MSEEQKQWAPDHGKIEIDIGVGLGASPVTFCARPDPALTLLDPRGRFTIHQYCRIVSDACNDTVALFVAFEPYTRHHLSNLQQYTLSTASTVARSDVRHS